MISFILSNYKLIGIGFLVITVLSLSGTVLYQKERISNVSNQLATVTKERDVAIFQRDSSVKAIGQMTRDIHTLSTNNRHLTLELNNSRQLIMEWADMSDSAIMNPYMDTEVINTYFGRMFSDFHCTTGGKCD